LEIPKKKPPAKAVVRVALAGFIKRPQFELNQRLRLFIKKIPISKAFINVYHQLRGV
jgi:hypothetical protein